MNNKEFIKEADKIFKEIEELLDKKANEDFDQKMAKHYFNTMHQLQKFKAQTIKYNYIDMSQKLMKIFPSIIEGIDCSIDELLLNLTEQGFL